MTDQVAADLEKINAMSREEMCRLWRFTPPGHSWFVSGSAQCEAFEKRFKELGGFSPEISKRLGW